MFLNREIMDASTNHDLKKIVPLFNNVNHILTIMTTNFVEDIHCRRLFLLLKKQLKKNVYLILLSKDEKWKKDSYIGILCSDHVGTVFFHYNLLLLIFFSSLKVYFNMENPKNFEAKCEEIRQRICTKNLDSNQDSSAFCFISYCWNNSRRAMAKSSNPNKTADFGKVDPRDLKDRLEKFGINCWIDIDKVGQTGGLHHDIAKGLKRAKIVICCISDEYVESENCMMEFNFAAFSLRRPIILVVVGTGSLWMKSEIIMAGFKFPKFNSQSLDEDIQDIAELVDNHLNPLVCFISYCRRNSRRSMAKLSGQNGDFLKTDPVDLRDKLEQLGIKCWMDFDMDESENFQDVTVEKLEKAKVIICCVSDEYVESIQCRSEFDFATTLRLPIIIVSLGNSTECMNSVIRWSGSNFPKVTIPIQSLEEDIKLIVPHIKEHVQANEMDLHTMNKIKKDEFSELLELTQRKYIKYISSILRQTSLPRLLVMDLIKNDICFYYLCESEEVR